MNGFPTELIYVLIVAGIVLFQYMMKRFGPQEQEQPPPPLKESDPELPAREREQDERLPQIPEEMKETPAASSVFRASHQLGGPEAQGAFSRLTRRRYSRRLLMGTRREVQNAIVIATIVGPCRAFEPYDVR